MLSAVLGGMELFLRALDCSDEMIGMLARLYGNEEKKRREG